MRHFTEADEPEKAVEYLLKAGDAARAVYADREALSTTGMRAPSWPAPATSAAPVTRSSRWRSRTTSPSTSRSRGDVRRGFRLPRPEDPRLPTTERLETASAGPGGDLSPGDVYSTEAGYFAELLFRGLLMVDSELNVVPAMADNFRVSSDGLTYLFRIKEDARWSDGEPLTADDYAYAWMRMRELGTRTAFLMEDVGAAEALDDRTLECSSASRGALPVRALLRLGLSVATPPLQSLGDDWAKPENLVGNGPFVLVEYGEEHALLQANPHWTGARGNVSEIHFSFYPKDSRMVEEWKQSLRPPHVYDPAPEDDPLTLQRPRSGGSASILGFCADRAPFSETNRSQGLPPVDREFLVSQYPRSASTGRRPGAGRSRRRCLRTPIESGSSTTSRRLEPCSTRPAIRTVRAPELTLVVPHWLQPVEPIHELWKPIGAHVNVVASKVHVTGEVLRDAHMWWSGWTADYPDPDGFFRGLLRLSVWPFYRDDDILELLERGRSLRDQGERMRDVYEVDRLWVGEHAAILPIAYPRSILPAPSVGRRPVGEPLVSGPSGHGRRRRAHGGYPRRAHGPGQAFRFQTRRRPSSVRSGSTVSIVSACGAISSARPPVAITGAVSPISSLTRLTMPST